MEFDLSEDQLALAGAANALLDDHASPGRVRAVVDAGTGFDPTLWSAMIEQGWCGIAVPEASGGVGLGWVEGAVLAEAVGNHVAPAPIVSQLTALEVLGGTDWFDDVLAGTAVAAVAGSPDDVVPFAPVADLFVTVVDGRLTATDLRGARPAAEPAMDLTRVMSRVAGTGEVIGDEASARHFLMTGAVLYSAEMLGIAARMLDETVAYAKERVQFDHPIGSFQAVKHRCADMLVDVEAMRSAVWWAAWCLGDGHPDAGVAASTAKSWCSDAVMRVLGSALQVHGGIGFTWECDVHLHLKRAQLDSVSFGTASWHRARLAGLLRERVATGASVI